MRFHTYITDTIHGSIGITDEERKVIDFHTGPLAPIQRLRELRQLGWVYMAYPTANHTRFEHSIGTMHLAGIISSYLGFNYDDTRRARFAGLLHDIGHGPFSHDSEPVLRYFKHMTHEDMTEHMIKDIYDFEQYGLDTEMIALDSVGKSKSVISRVLFGKEEHSRLSIDADFLDYILRDNYYSGAKITSLDMDRIMQSFILQDDRIFFSSTTAVLPIMSAINSRNHLGLRVYFHKTSEFAEDMWVKAFYDAVNAGADIDEVWMMGDMEALLKVGTYDGLPREIVERLRMRDINKWVVAGKIEGYANTIPINKAKCETISIEDVKRLSHLRDDLQMKHEIEDYLAREFHVRPGHLTLCAPPVPALDISEMKSSIYFLNNDGSITRFDDCMTNLESICETNKMSYFVALTVPSEYKNRVLDSAGTKNIFDEILSMI